MALGPADHTGPLAATLLDHMSPGGSTYLSGGLSAGFAALVGAPDPAAGDLTAGDLTAGDATGDLSQRVRRVLLMTDGQANQGVVDQAGLAGLARRDGFSVSTIGVGLDYDEAILSAMADAGGGEYHYVGRDTDLASVYRAELQNAGSVVATDTLLDLTFPVGVHGQRACSWTFEVPDASHLRVRLGDLAAGQTRTVVVPITIDAAVADGVIVSATRYQQPEADAAATRARSLKPRRLGRGQGEARVGLRVHAGQTQRGQGRQEGTMSLKMSRWRMDTGPSGTLSPARLGAWVTLDTGESRAARLRRAHDPHLLGGGALPRSARWRPGRRASLALVPQAVRFREWRRRVRMPSEDVVRVSLTAAYREPALQAGRLEQQLNVHAPDAPTREGLTEVAHWVWQLGLTLQTLDRDIATIVPEEVEVRREALLRVQADDSFVRDRQRGTLGHLDRLLEHRAVLTRERGRAERLQTYAVAYLEEARAGLAVARLLPGVHTPEALGSVLERLSEHAADRSSRRNAAREVGVG